MKEIKILLRQLRSYPEMFFVYPVEDIVLNPNLPLGVYSTGLMVCDKDGNRMGFIETGTNNGVVVID